MTPFDATTTAAAVLPMLPIRWQGSSQHRLAVSVGQGDPERFLVEVRLVSLRVKGLSMDKRLTDAPHDARPAPPGSRRSQPRRTNAGRQFTSLEGDRDRTLFVFEGAAIWGDDCA
jgi:hypothetical protein